MLFTLTVLLSILSLTVGKVFQVEVGRNEAGELATVFVPNQITAQQGDRVEFVFRGKNHSVTQSTFAEPCTRQFNAASNLAGVDSGFMAVAATATEIPVYSIQVVDATAPQWFFCNQGNHCNMGMVFAINAPTSGEKSFDKWVELARTATHPDPATSQNLPTAPSLNSGTGSENSGNSGNSENSGNNNGLGSSSGSFTTSFSAAPTQTSGTSFGTSSRTAATTFVGSIPANAVTAVQNADTAAATAANLNSAGYRLEPRGVIGMVLVGAMSLALGL